MSQCRLSDVTKDYLAKFYNILDDMIQGMSCLNMTDSISENFIAQMIPHHQGAVEMCQNALRYDICPGLCPICRDIISSQCRGINQMQNLLRTLNC